MTDRPRNAPNAAPLDQFEFENAGRTFTCSAEAPRPARPEGWWWFSLATAKRGQRYAPFRTSPGDTRANVEARIVAYYDDLLVRQAMPATSNHWGRRREAGASTTTGAAPAVAAGGVTAA